MEFGKVIVFEGCCNGNLKKAQHNLLGNRLTNDNEKVILHHFPSYGTEQGNFIKMYLACRYGELDELSPYFVNSLYAYDRAITWHGELKEEYFNGSCILLDRYTTSSLISQSKMFKNMTEKKDFINYVCDFEYNKLGIQRPDLVLFLHSSFENRLAYIRDDHNLNKKDIENIKREYDNALFVADYLNWEMIECENEKKLLDNKTIHEDIYKRVRKKYNK